jgi:hypothetical protein
MSLETSQAVHGIGLLAFMLSVALLITPSMTHQVTYRGEDRKGALRVATRCAGLAMLPMTLGLGSTTFVVFESLFNRNIGIVAGITFAAVAVEITGKPVFVRELLPQDLKIEMNALDRKEAARVAGYLAAVVGEAHGRQMQGNDRRAWYKELRRNRAKALNAPSWLWRSVVDLLLEHQRGYLEHCRAVSAAG